MISRKLFVLICVLLFVQTAFAQENWENYLYNADYANAIQCLEKKLEINPNQPAIYWKLCCVLSFKINATNNIKGSNSAPKEEQEKLEKEFNELFDTGIALCDSNSTDSEILFYLGALYANKVFFKQAIGQRNKSLLDDTKKSREYLEEIKKTEDFYDEACGYLGIFNYGPIVMSGLEKKFARLFIDWDESLGLQQIKDAIKYSKYSDYFKSLYRGTLQAVVERRRINDKIPEAIELTEELLEKYPRNLELKIELVALYCKKGDLVAAKKMGDKVFKEIYSKRYYVSHLYNKLAKIRSEISKELKKKK